ncbi:DUF692 domain-containing protein [Streptomyces sp. NPDC003036]|uniref:DUF692 domain-containing protein n=1 Tax=Streptomyces sp. NPDC003036 TaxID=3154442 RepID=UPI00339DBF9A
MPRNSLPDLPELGVGLGYRSALHDDTLAARARIDWLEIVTDRFLRGRDAELLLELRRSFTLVPHGVELSIGSDAPLDQAYLDAVAAVADAVDAPWVSDHLAFTRERGVDLLTLAPVLRTEEKAAAVAAKARAVEDRLGRPFLLENITYYMEMPGGLSEAEFITTVLERCDSGLLLDLNNVATNAVNHHFDPYAFLDAIPLDRVVQVHLAGNVPEEPSGGLVVDRHDGPVSEDVFALLEYVAARVHLKAVSIERDQHFPDDFGELLDELTRTRSALAASQSIGHVTAGALTVNAR